MPPVYFSIGPALPPRARGGNVPPLSRPASAKRPCSRRTDCADKQCSPPQHARMPMHPVGRVQTHRPCQC
eukprot:3352604-Prymnesium_polylepis.1